MTKHAKAYLALIYICIVWGTTYLAMKVGVRHFPAILFAGLRQTAGGLILMPAALLLSKEKDLSAKNILRQMLVGFLMLTIGNGGVTWGVRHIPSGTAALVCSMMPIFAVMFNLVASKKERLNWAIASGMILGFCGVGLIFRDNVGAISKPAYLGGVLVVLFGNSGWALGSIVNKKNSAQVNPFFNSGLQLFFGGIFMLLLSPVVDDYHDFQPWNADGILALIYLIIFGSALAYAAYMYALKILPVGIATLYSYINPLIAVLAGYLFLNEALNIYTALAFITIAISVYLVNRGYRQQHKKDLKKEPDYASAFPESIPES